MEHVQSLFFEFGRLLAELVVLMLLVAAALALFARRLGIVRIRRWLGGARLGSALKGASLGFLIPFCTYSAIPVLTGMIQARMRTAAIASFLLAAPVLDPIVLAALLVLFGWQATLAYSLVTFVTVIGMSVLADTWSLNRHLVPVVAGGQMTGNSAYGASDVEGEPECWTGDPFTDDREWRGWRSEAESALTYAFGIMRSLAVPLVIAVAFAAVIVGTVPEGFISGFAGPGNPLAVPAAALLGAPFYVSTEAFLPIAAALSDRGMSIGAVFALVISASGVNIPELGLLSRLMRWPLLVAYTSAVVGIAIIAGFLIPFLL